MKAYRQGGMVDTARWWHTVDNAPKRPIASRTSGGGQPDHRNVTAESGPSQGELDPDTSRMGDPIHGSETCNLGMLYSGSLHVTMTRRIQ